MVHGTTTLSGHTLVPCKLRSVACFACVHVTLLLQVLVHAQASLLIQELHTTATDLNGCRILDSWVAEANNDTITRKIDTSTHTSTMMNH